MKISYFLTILFPVLLLCFSCKQYQYNVEVVSLSPDLEMGMLSDSTFFNIVQGVSEYNGDVYMSVDQRMQIARMDKALILKNTIGNKGRGPGEFVYLDKFFVTGDEVWVSNFSSFMKFSKDGKYISSVETVKNPVDAGRRFWIDRGKIYFSSYDMDAGTSMAVLDVEKNNYTPFGEIKDFENPVKTSSQNRYDVFVCGDYVVAVPLSIPIIEIYDKNTLKLKDVFDVTTIPEIKEWYNQAINNPNLIKPTTVFGMTKDAYLHEDLLYVLYFTPRSMLDKTPKEYLSTLVFNVGDGKIRYIKRYNFGEEDIYRICVTQEYIYGATNQGVLKRYPLKQ